MEYNSSSDNEWGSFLLESFIIKSQKNIEYINFGNNLMIMPNS
jgi:hypothetical protein